MSGAERCDEILRLIDEVLATCEARPEQRRRVPPSAHPPLVAQVRG